MHTYILKASIIQYMIIQTLTSFCKLDLKLYTEPKLCLKWVPVHGLEQMISR